MMFQSTLTLDVTVIDVELCLLGSVMNMHFADRST